MIDSLQDEMQPNDKNVMIWCQGYLNFTVK